jgi:hypothetical protein
MKTVFKSFCTDFIFHSLPSTLNSCHEELVNESGVFCHVQKAAAVCNFFYIFIQINGKYQNSLKMMNDPLVIKEEFSNKYYIFSS